MKKTLFLLAALLALTFSLAGCGNTPNSAVTANPQDEAAANFAKDADKNIDMDKVDGTALTASDDDIEKGTVGATEIAITDATVINYNEEDVVIVSFEFTNKTGEETTFSAEEDANAYQGNFSLPPAVVVNVEGIDCNTVAQPVKNGKTITVQKAFYLKSADAPLTVEVLPSNPNTEIGTVSRTFDFQ